MTHRFASTSASGTATVWAPLPDAQMLVTFDVENGDSVLLLASISQLQHSIYQANTALRIVVDGAIVVALSNTGNAQDLRTATPSLHGVVSGLGSGLHTAELQYQVRPHQ